MTYPVIGLLPLDGAVQVSVAEESPAVAAVMTGWPGTVYGTTAFDCGLAALVPSAFVAVTVKVYDAPTVSPVSVRVVVEASKLSGVWATPLRMGVTVYPVMGLPLLAGAVQVTVAAATPAVAVGAAGAAGLSV